MFSPIRRNPTITAFISSLSTNPNSNDFFEPVEVSLPIRYLRLGTHIISNDYITNNREDFNDCCSICQEPLINNNNQSNETIKFIRCINHCGHCFHKNCIDQWFETSCQCPMCRIDIRDSVDLTQNTENIQQSNNVENNQNSEN